MERPMKALIVSGALLALLGIVGFAIPVFTTQQTMDVAKVGSLQIQTQEDTAHTIPPLASGSALVLGLVLLGGGLYRRQ